MDGIEKAIASAIRAQAEDDISGWFEQFPDGTLSIEYEAFDIRKFIAALEAAGYRIEPVKPDASAP
jgi:hypothetical protein